MRGKGFGKRTQTTHFTRYPGLGSVRVRVIFFLEKTKRVNPKHPTLKKIPIPYSVYAAHQP